ncbi:MAG: hypothetical protein QM783_10490 [Phycisphaerales bacterium]
MTEASAKQVKPRRYPGRKRRTAGTILLALALLVATAWGASRWWRFSYDFEDGQNDRVLYFTRGFFGYWQRTVASNQFSPGWSTEKLDDESIGCIWWFGWTTDQSAASSSSVFWGVAGATPSTGSPSGFVARWMLFWPVVLVLTASGASVWWSGSRARKRAITGCCRHCGYSLAGLAPDAACPECGRPSAP